MSNVVGHDRNRCTMHKRAWLASWVFLMGVGACVGEDLAIGVKQEPDGGDETSSGAEDAGGDTRDAQATFPPNCDKTAVPSQDPCVVHEGLGVFVTTFGNDETGDGTRDRPYATIGYAIAKAQAAHKRVYACEGVYNAEGTVQLRNDVSVFGGLWCQSALWKVEPGARVVLRPTQSPALRAKDISTKTLIEGVDVFAPDAVEPGASSIGLIAENAVGLTFRRSSITAGTAADGANGVEPAPLVAGTTLPGASTIATSRARGLPPNDKPPKQPKAPDGGTSRCSLDGEATLQGHSGGAGGYSTWYWYSNNQPTGGELFNGEGLATTGAGGTWAPARAPGAGSAGLTGDSGANGTTFTIDKEGYHGAPGVEGAPGTGGQGGGGGAPTPPPSPQPETHFWGLGGLGSGGGAGGCPGIPGTAGGAGGASIAVLSFDSLLTFEASPLTAARGGLGGRGTFGNAPTAGNPGGNCTNSTHVSQCGAPGGDGGKAGWSGHSLSGASIAIAVSGLPPTLTNSALTIAAVREGQSAITDPLDATKVIPTGTAGTSQEIYEIP